MKNITNKREQEKKLVSQMIAIYCHKNHGTKSELCDACKELDEYAQERSDKCPFMETKTFCSNCKVHCYKADKREQIREVMRFSGPRMLLYNPVIVARHMIESLKEKRKLEEKRCR